MNTKRLPVRGYVRQLQRMRDDLDAWYASYRHTAAAQPDMWRAARFEERAAVLSDVVAHLQEAQLGLHELPRTS